MFIGSIKLKRLLTGLLFAVFAAILLVIIFMPSSGGERAFNNIKNNEDRRGFLEAFGWEVSAEAVAVEDITVPAEFNEIYSVYNDIQKAEGFDLTKYSGKSVKCWTYVVTNHPDAAGASVFANILIYNNKVIGGDICSARMNGFIHGFSGRVE